MPTLDVTLTFFAVAVLLALTPGPDNLFVLMISASQGRRAGVLVTLGLCAGLVVHTAAVALGLAAIFAASNAAFVVLKFAGAAYLLYLAWHAWRAPIDSTATAADESPPIDSWRLITRGIVMNLTNPKVVLFFLAFLPQFVRPEAGAVAFQIAWFGLVFIIAAFCVFSTIACLAGFIGGALRRSPRLQQILNRSAAIVFAALALRLALARR